MNRTTLSAEKAIGPIEAALRVRVAALGESIPSQHPADELLAKILAKTWPSIVEKLNAIAQHRDWQFRVWRGSTQAALDHCEAEAQRLIISVELVEEAVSRILADAAKRKAAA